MTDIQKVDAIQFESGMYLVHPYRRIKSMGSIATPPYVVKHDISYYELAKTIVDTLKFSTIGIAMTKSEEDLFHKDNVKKTGIKNNKMLHEKSKLVSVFTKENRYHLNPYANRGSRIGFIGIKEARMSIPQESSLEQLANALEEAFGKCI